MKKVMLVIALIAAALGFVGTAQATGDDTVCTVTVVDKEAWDQKVITQEYVPAKDAVTKTQYKFVHKKEGHPNSPRWEDDPNWNADSNPHSKGWYSTGETRELVIEEAVAEVPEISHIVHHETTYKDVEEPCDDEPVVDPPVTDTPTVDPPQVDKPSTPTRAPEAGLPNTGA